VSQSSQHPTTVLAHGQVHLSDTLKVELVQPDGEPARIVVSWPNNVTVCTQPDTPKPPRQRCGFWLTASPNCPGSKRASGDNPHMSRAPGNSLRALSFPTEQATPAY
jgi:hypothetical protein